MPRVAWTDFPSVAFEQTQSLSHKLTFKIDALGRRDAALLSATTALETVTAQRAGSQAASNSNSADALGAERPTASAPPQPVRPDAPQLTQMYVHRELPDAIQHG